MLAKFLYEETGVGYTDQSAYGKLLLEWPELVRAASDSQEAENTSLKHRNEADQTIVFAHLDQRNRTGASLEILRFFLAPSYRNSSNQEE